MSNGALCATITQPCANSRNAGSTEPIRGDEATIPLVMPVRTAMNGGIGSDGLTSVWNSPITSPPRTFTAPISVIPDSPGAPPVVSRSTTQNVMSRSGVPRSSKLGCTPRIGVNWSGAGLVMATTLRAATDNSAGDTRRSRLGSLYAYTGDYRETGASAGPLWSASLATCSALDVSRRLRRPGTHLEALAQRPRCSASRPLPKHPDARTWTPQSLDRHPARSTEPDLRSGRTADR
jgi:hypothetical protein